MNKEAVANGSYTPATASDIHIPHDFDVGRGTRLSSLLVLNQKSTVVKLGVCTLKSRKDADHDYATLPFILDVQGFPRRVALDLRGIQRQNDLGEQ